MRFTAANARELAAKAHAARRQRLASGIPATETSPLTPQVGPHEAANDYVSRRLARVRVQLDLVDRRIAEQANRATVDGQLLNWLCAAQERLAEQERILSGHPLPGSRKPSPERVQHQAALQDLPAPTLLDSVSVQAAPAKLLRLEHDPPPSVPVAPHRGC